MLILPSLTNIRNHAVELFHMERTKAIRDSLLEKISGRSSNLPSFPGKELANMYNRRFLGLIEIPIDKISGTISRNHDFDRKFRPLNKHLLQRWIDIYATFEKGDFPPILVHKVGDAYYVEDGHHRTSIARTMGRSFISAEVWEYAYDTGNGQVNQAEQPICSTECQAVEPCPA